MTSGGLYVHVSVDMEGVAGIADPADVTPGSDQYETSRRLMTAECNAVVEGCFDAGAARVVVNDAHGTMRNLVQAELDPRARLIRGWAKRLGMMEGVADGVDAAMFVGYHAGAGNGDGVLNHTMSSRHILGVRVNTEPAGELRLNAAMAGWLGVPVVLVSGDDVVCGEASAILRNVETVEVKRAIDRHAASSLHPAEARGALRAGARRALERLGDAAPYQVTTPATVSVEWASTSSAALCEGVPGVERVSARGVRFSSDDYAEAYRLLIVLGLLVEGTEALRR